MGCGVHIVQVAVGRTALLDLVALAGWVCEALLFAGGGGQAGGLGDEVAAVAVGFEAACERCGGGRGAKNGGCRHAIRIMLGRETGGGPEDVRCG